MLKGYLQIIDLLLVKFLNFISSVPVTSKNIIMHKLQYAYSLSVLRTQFIYWFYPLPWAQIKTASRNILIVVHSPGYFKMDGVKKDFNCILIIIRWIMIRTHLSLNSSCSFSSLQLDIYLNGNPVDALGTVVHAEKALDIGKSLCLKLQKVMSR